jgi:polyhydroxyalkanoate synthesis regulator phasin
MSETRRQVLEMLAAGRITAEEAERLIAALERDAPPAAERLRAAKRKYLRVMVDSDEPGQGPVRVNTRVPMQLLRAGVKLANLIPPQARAQVDKALHEHGIPIDMGGINANNLEEIINQLEELTVDVDVDEHNQKVKVKVFCE